MSNYFILISDRVLSSKLISKRIDIPKSIVSNLSFEPRFAYIVEPDANDRKELITRKYAPDLYKQTSLWFKSLSDLIYRTKTNNSNVVIIETYYNQDLKQIVWDVKKIPMKDLDNEEFSFSFDTIYDFIL